MIGMLTLLIVLNVFDELLGISLDGLSMFVSLMALVVAIMVSTVSMLVVAYQLHFIGWKNPQDSK